MRGEWRRGRDDGKREMTGQDIDMLDVNTKQAFEDCVIGCVAIPVLSSDLDGPLQAMFSVWNSPNFFPRLTGNSPRPQLLIVINNGSNEDVARVQAIADLTPLVRDCFAGITVRNADLKGDMDVYSHEVDPIGAVYGTRAGPNFLFYRTMRAAEKFGGFTLQVELDCLPVQAGWLDQVQEIIADHKMAWLIGSQYAGSGDLGEDIQEHINGNALYRTGSREFQAFLSDIWMPRLLKHAQTRRDLAYDCWWAFERSQASAMAGNEAWNLLQSYSSFFHVDPFVINLMSPEENARQYLDVYRTFDALGRPPVFLHGRALARVRDLISTKSELTIFEAINEISPVSKACNLPENLKSVDHPKGEVDNQFLEGMATDWISHSRERARLLLEKLADYFDIDSESAIRSMVPPHPMAKAVSDAFAVLEETHPSRLRLEQRLYPDGDIDTDRLP